MELENRRLDRFKTGALVAVAAGIASYLIGTQFADDNAGSNAPPKGGNSILVPVFRFGR